MHETPIRLVNLTPHKVVVRTENGDVVYEPSGQVARVSTSEQYLMEVPDSKGNYVGVYLYEQTFGDIEGLPEPEEGVLYIVSLPVREAAKEKGRTDVISPDTSPAGVIRDEQGRIVAVKRFVR